MIRYRAASSKSGMASHFLTRTKDGVNAEMSLFVLAYNIKRMIKILGMKPLLGAIRAHREGVVAFLTSDMASSRLLRLLFLRQARTRRSASRI